MDAVRVLSAVLFREHMIKTLAKFLTTFFLLSSFLVPTTPAQQPASGIASNAAPPSAMPSDPMEILNAGAVVNGLHGSDLKPWHIKATYQLFDPNGKPKNSGSFEEFWITDKKYKITYESSDFKQTEYGTEGGIYRSGSQDWPGNPEFAVMSYLTSPVVFPKLSAGFVVEKKTQKFGSASLQCVVIAAPRVSLSRSAYCFELDRPMLRAIASTDGQSQTLCNSIVQFQGHFVSRDTRETLGGKPRLTIQIQEINALTTDNIPDITPSADAAGPLKVPIIINKSAFNWRVLSQALPVYPVEAKQNGMAGTVPLHVKIGVDGSVLEAQATGGPRLLQASALEAIRKWWYQPLLLLGEPTEYDADTEIVYSLGR
jgi:TonB family protein